MTKSSQESVVFVVGGAATGVGVSATVGGMGLVGGFGGISLGVVPVTAAGAVAGAAIYGASKALEESPVAFGAFGIGAIAGAGVSSAIGGMGLSFGGTAFGIGMGTMAAAGGVVGLGIYGFAKMLDGAGKEPASQTFARMEEKISDRVAYTQALLELDPVLAEFNWKQKFAALEVEEELQALKAVQSKPSVHPEETCSNVSKLPCEPESKQNFGPQVENRQLEVTSTETWKCIATLKGHTASINSLAINPQGNVLASTSDDKTVSLWNLQTKKQQFTFFGSAEIYAIAISPDGETIVAGDFENKITSWQLETKAYNCTFSGKPGSAYSHAGLVYALAFSPDGKTIASASADRTVRLWHRNGTVKRTLTGHTDAVCSVVFSRDGQIVASGSGDRTIRLWKITAQEQPRILSGHSGWVTSLAISPNGRILASGSTDSTIKLWNLDTGELLNTCIGHAAGVWSVAISPDAKLIASGSNDGSIKLWGLEGKLLNKLSGQNPVAFCSNGIVCGGNGNTIKIWKRVTEEESKLEVMSGEWWEVFGVNRNATVVQVKSAYRHLVKQYHPDINPSANAKVNMQTINQVYRQFLQEREGN